MLKVFVDDDDEDDSRGVVGRYWELNFPSKTTVRLPWPI